MFEQKLSTGQKYSLVERSDFTKKTNSGYTGFLYREVRGICEVVKAEIENGTTYEGKFYILEEIKKQAKPVAQKIDVVYPTKFSINFYGEYIIDDKMLYPTLRNFPIFPKQALKVGDKWQAYGLRIVEPKRDGLYTKVKFYCDYQYKGLVDLNGKLCHLIQAQYAMRYKRGDDPTGDERISSISGKHVVSIYLDATNNNLLFMKDTVEEIYQYTDGTTESYKGFILTWFNMVVLFNKEEVVKELKNDFTKTKITDVTIEPVTEGLLLTVNNIYFYPDQAIVLADEMPRLKALASILKKFSGRTILVRGHTAQWGSVESQFSLSLERAKTIVNYLIQEGIPAEYLIYEGKGATQPLASNETEEGRKKNRRVEIIILEN